MTSTSSPPGMTRSSPWRTFLGALFTRRAWAELLYALIALPVGIAGFVFTVTTLSVSAGLAITWVGIPLLAATGLVSRWLGAGWRRGAHAIVGWRIPAMPPLNRPKGFLAGMWVALKDGAVWRSRLYWALKFPLGIASFVAGVVAYSIGFGFTTYWFWYRWTPCQTSPGSDTCHRGARLWNGAFIDTPWEMVGLFVVGVVVLLLAPWVVRGVITLDRLAMRALLGPPWFERIVELEESRARVVGDSDAALRRIERDLHDGTQARLVAVAMNVGLAKEKLAEQGAPRDTIELLEQAHVTAKEAITEVRDLARGIHPAALDTGLDAALATLAGRSAIPTELDYSLDARPEPPVEAIAYFCAAELMTNVAKHSGATRATIFVRSRADTLILRVADDGRGGAHVAHGGGLAGLAERVRAVDGQLFIDAPVGGPTVVSIELPLAVPGARREN